MKYHASYSDLQDRPLDLVYATDAELEKWGADPNCYEMDACARVIADRLIKRRIDGAAKREELRVNPFDPRTEISADAKQIAGRIVSHLWILFVLLPLVAGALWTLLGMMR